MGDEARRMVKGYELRERLGAGGFGAVYKAYQSTVGRDVAIKIILPTYANHPDFVRRFEAEAQIIARLEHLHIVPLYDYWRDPDGAYLVMRWLKGGSLREGLARAGAYDLHSAALLMEQITSALTAAHQQQIVHRDLKPGNILLDEDDNAYLADFGIAKDLTNADSITHVDAIIGSPDYLAPEQARSELVTPQTDVYSLGVVLYELLTGQHPFPNLSAVERLYKHLNEPLPMLDALPPDVREAVNTVIQTATAKNPNQRYQSAAEMAAAFANAVNSHTRKPLGNIVELLTPREQDILHRIIDGRSNKEIAGALFITVATVKWYITQIYQKLGVRSRVQAIVRARELHLITAGAASRSGEGQTAATVIPTDQFHPVNPYKGLRSFQSADHQDFFGREKLVGRLVSRLGESGDAARLLAVVGPSGSGKSSAIKAGLIPALWRGALPGSERWFMAEMIPGARPLDELEVALMRVATLPVGNLNEQLARDRYGLIRAASLILPNDGSELVLLIDQFEELFTLVQDEAARLHFINLLASAVTEPRSRVRVILTLRADFYDRPLQYAEFGEIIRSRVETVLPLSSKELEHAVVNPAQRVSVHFEDGLASAIVEAMHYQVGALPLMQYALTELFERRNGHQLTHAAYQEMGGAIGALAKRAEDLYREFDAAGQMAVRQLFLRLVTLGDGTGNTRRRVHRSELLGLTDAGERMDDIIDTFTEYRLLSLDHDPATRSPTVEVAHEAILREWERLSEWIESSQSDIQTGRQLSRAAEDWQAGGRDASFLMRGIRLTQFERWAATTELALTAREREFLQSSIDTHAQEQTVEQARQEREVRLERRSRQFLRGLVAVLVAATLGAFVLTGIALTERGGAQRNAERAQSLALASAAQAALREQDSEQALALSIVANRFADPPAYARQMLYEAAFAPAAQFVIDGGTGWRWAVDISPDGRSIALQEDEVRVAIWDLHTRTVQTRLDGNHPDGLAGMTFTPDGNFLLVGAWDDALEMWSLANGELIWQSVNPPGDPNRIAISPDGSTALVGSESGITTIWNVQTGEFLGELAGHDPAVQVQGVDFSPDGLLAVTSGEDGAVIVWDVAQRAIVRRLQGHDAIVFTAVFSPNGRMIASSAFDGTVRLWNVATGELIRTLAGHSDYVFGVDWSPDGTRLLSASRDSTLILWDAESGMPLNTYRDASGRVLTASFIDDGHAVSGGSSSNVRVWSLLDERMQRQITVEGEAVETMTVNRDRTLGAFGVLGAVMIIDLQTDEELHRLHHDGGTITRLTFMPDEKVMGAGFEDGSLVMWDIESGRTLRRFEGHTGIETSQFTRILDLGFSPDGMWLISGAEDREMIVWDIETGGIVHRFENCSGTVNSGAFSPDGTRIAGAFGALSEPTRGFCGEADLNVHLWDANTGAPLRQFSGHTDAVRWVRFTPDGRLLLSGSIDETLRIWDVEAGDELHRLSGHTGGVTHFDISPDGRYIASGDGAGIVRLWDIETGDLLRQIEAHDAAVTGVFFDNNTDGVWSSSGDSIRFWAMMPDSKSLLSWIADNRFVRDLTCTELTRFELSQGCT